MAVWPPFIHTCCIAFTLYIVHPHRIVRRRRQGLGLYLRTATFFETGCFYSSATNAPFKWQGTNVCTVRFAVKASLDTTSNSMATSTPMTNQAVGITINKNKTKSGKYSTHEGETLPALWWPPLLRAPAPTPALNHMSDLVS